MTWVAKETSAQKDIDPVDKILSVNLIVTCIQAGMEIGEIASTDTP